MRTKIAVWLPNLRWLTEPAHSFVPGIRVRIFQVLPDGKAGKSLTIEKQAQLLGTQGLAAVLCWRSAFFQCHLEGNAEVIGSISPLLDLGRQLTVVLDQLDAGSPVLLDQLTPEAVGTLLGGIVEAVTEQDHEDKEFVCGHYWLLLPGSSPSAVSVAAPPG